MPPKIAALISWPDRLFEALQAPFALLVRCYVAWQFLDAGYYKIKDWEQTLALFEYEYKVPVLSPWWGAVLGTAGELVFPVLLILGLGGRWTPLGLFAVNLMAVVSYAHVLLTENGLVGLRDHQIWGLMLAMLIVYGMGRWSLDALLLRRRQ
jgi:putative oxidoreductase